MSHRQDQTMPDLVPSQWRLARSSQVPHLFLVISAADMQIPPVRYCLQTTDQIDIGRGQPFASRNEQNGQSRLVISVPDKWMSTRHATVTRTTRGWMLTDRGSRNGSKCNGQPVAQAMLSDGDVLEIGHTFWRFRFGLGCDAMCSELPNPRPPDAPGLQTLLPPLAQQFSVLAGVSQSPVPVLLQGVSGTGKELVARSVHALSRRPGSFIAINCGALPSSLIQSELFGYVKGAFTGALQDRPGLFRAAQHGTLLLDEIGDLPMELQTSLLRVLQEHEVVPVGGTQAIPLDVRMCAATHHHLEQRVAEGKFRADLYARLTGITLRLPALHERKEDFGLILVQLLCKLRGSDRGHPSFSPGAMRNLLAHPWPFNIRELEKCLQRAIALAGNEVIRTPHLFPMDIEAHPVVPMPPAPLAIRTLSVRRAWDGQPLDEGEFRQRFIALLEETHGNVTAVAERLQRQRVQIRRWLRRWQLDPKDFAQDKPAQRRKNRSV